MIFIAFLIIVRSTLWENAYVFSNDKNLTALKSFEMDVKEILYIFWGIIMAILLSGQRHHFFEGSSIHLFHHRRIMTLYRLDNIDKTYFNVLACTNSLLRESGKLQFFLHKLSKSGNLLQKLVHKPINAEIIKC